MIAPKGFAHARAVLAGEEVATGDPLPLLRDDLRVVAVGFDGGPESRAALAEAAALGERFGAALRVIAVETSARPMAAGFAGAPQPGWQLQAQLLDAVAQLPAEVRALPEYEQGDPVERLLEHTYEGVDLLVLGSRGYGPVLRLIAGSVSVQVIRAARCPVLLVPRPAEAGLARSPSRPSFGSRA